MGCGGSAITPEGIQSDIMIKEQHKEYLIEILSQKLKTSKFALNLLYSGRKNGFEASSFHQHCDNKGRTVVIIESQTGNIFGGFTNVPWSTDNQYHADANAFLFILKNQNGEQKIVPLRSAKDAAHAVQHIASKGPSFGEAIHAICIDNKPHINANSYTRDGSSFQFDGNELCGGNEETDDTYYFKVKNYEVYQVA